MCQRLVDFPFENLFLAIPKLFLTIGRFSILKFILDLWSDLLTLTAVASNLEWSEGQISHNRLLINMTIGNLYNKSDA